MGFFARPSRVALAIASWLALSPAVRGDGNMIDAFGRYVPEHEQQAVIQWCDGQERLYVATRAASTGGPSPWLVPVPPALQRLEEAIGGLGPGRATRGRHVEAAGQRLAKKGLN